jgi:serine/threonine protein kinase
MKRDPFDLVGDVLDGQFRVDAFAGEGDLSVVYKGHHLGVDAPVAIKCLNLPETLDPALARPLVDGFKEASRVHYKLARGNLHIAQTIASGSTLVPRSGVVVPYLVREWFEGESLASDLAWRRSEKHTGRPLDEALALLETAFDGIAHAHAQGEVHLSINPSNLFVVHPEGEALPTLKVLDFGVSSTMNAFATVPTGARGGRSSGGLRLLFPAYAAPEQLDRAVGELGPWTDVYAIALVMMEVLSDRVVMGEGDSGAIVEHALDEQRRPTPTAHGLKLPSHIERALTRAVSRSPSRRQKSAAELWKDVRNTIRTLAPRAVMPVAGVATPPPQRIVTPPPGRARAATLVGLSPPAILSVPGAAQRAGSTSVVTKPMSFEPAGATAALPASRTPLPMPVLATPPPPPRVSAVPAPPIALPLPPVPSAPALAPLPPPLAPAPPVSVMPVVSVSAFPAPPPAILPAPPGLPSAPPGLPSAPPGIAVPARPPSAPPAPVTGPALPATTLPAPPLAGAAPAAFPPGIDSPAPSSTDFARDSAPVLARERIALGPPRRRFANPIAYAFSPRGAPVVLAVSGGLFWLWALGIFVWFVGLPHRHPRTATVTAEPTAEPVAEAARGVPVEPIAQAARAVPVEPAGASPTGPAHAPPTEPGPAPEPALVASPPPAEPAAVAAGGAPFRNAAAVRALDGKWREVAKCRRGKTWGKGPTTVTFAGDGSVTHVEVGPPFTGTPTGDCIAETLSSTRVEPFSDSSAVLVYRVYVAPK